MEKGTNVFLLVLFIALATTDAQYNGKLIGSFEDYPGNSHDIIGDVYAVDDDTIRILGFSYDGTAPDSYVRGGDTGSEPSANGFDIGSRLPQAYDNFDLGDLDLPAGKTVSDLKWICVWCKRFNVNFNDITPPANFVPPAEHDLGALSGSSGLSASAVVIANDKEIRLEGLNYDGSCSGAQFWAGSGSTPSSSGHIVPDENGNSAAIGSYSGQTITLRLPSGESVFDIGYIGVWCGGADVGHVDIPPESSLNIPPEPL